MRRRAELVSDDRAQVTVLIAPPGFGCSELLAAMSPRTGDVLRLQAEVVEGALRALSSASAPSQLIIGEVDRLNSVQQRSLGEAVEATIASSPDMRIALWTRTRPCLPLARWQVDGVAEVITIHRLLLDAAALHAELGLDGAQLDQALASTGGWPSAVTLLSQHLEHSTFDAALAAARSEHVRFVAEEVLTILTDAERQLLGSLTVLDHLDDTSVTRFTGNAATPGALRSLAERTQLLGPATGALSWHPDVRAALAQEVERSEPGSLPSLHRAAAAALAHDRSQLGAQLDHLIRADAWDDALALVTQRWHEFIEPDRLDGLVAGIASMPPDLLAQDVRSSLGAGAVLLVWGDAASAADFFEAGCVQSDPCARATAAALLAHSTWWSTAPEQALHMVETAERVLDTVPGAALVAVPGFETFTTGRSMLIVSRARALALTGQLADAAQLLNFLPCLRRDDPVSESVSAWSTKALVDALTGELILATDALEMSMALAQGGGWNSTVSVAPAHLARALVTFGSGAPTDPWPDVAAAMQSAVRARAWGLARLAGAVGALVGSVDRVPLERAGSAPARAPFADRVTAAFRARHAFRSGRRDQASASLGIAEPIEPAIAPWIEVAIEVHGQVAAAAVLNALEPPRTPLGRVDRMLAASLLEPDDTRIAVHAASVASELGLRGILRHGSFDIKPEPVASMSDGDRDRTGLVDTVAVSERGREILRLLDSPKSIVEIGQELFVSVNTVKWHLRQLYRHLGVHNRVDAVLRGRQMGLIGVDESRTA
jgi:LuxR family maltose regulon positive regulatory protein